MKTLVKTIMICLAFSMIACNSDDNNNETLEESLVFENNETFIIPDATGDFEATVPSVVRSSILVNKKGVIAKPWKVNIGLNLELRQVSSKYLELFAPTGESIKLINSGYYEFQAGNIVTFNSGAVSPIPPVSNPVPTGTYLPSSGSTNTPVVDLAAFLEGKEIDGTWTLKITDTRRDGDSDPVVEKVLGWKITFESDALQN